MFFVLLFPDMIVNMVEEPTVHRECLPSHTPQFTNGAADFILHMVDSLAPQ